ncbi:MAG: dockerin type I repeat-containing protein, partial [Muribaculaceae bacterium]|nr:dockerin type I repeat-containing protein [Muribaculaceae bacterium]
TNSYFKLNAATPEFNKVTTPTTFRRGYAYLKLSNSETGGATTITTSFVSDALPGDVNGDGIVSSVDITAIYNYLLNNDPSAILNGDQNGDSIISSVDITIIYNILLGNGE